MTSSIIKRASFHVSLTSLGTRGPSPLSAVSTRASLKIAAEAFTAALTTAGVGSWSNAVAHDAHEAIWRDASPAMRSLNPAIVLRTAALGSTRISNSAGANSSRRPGSLSRTSSASSFSLAHLPLASPESFASFSAVTACSCVQDDGVPPPPFARDAAAPLPRDDRALGGIVRERRRRARDLTLPLY